MAAWRPVPFAHYCREGMPPVIQVRHLTKRYSAEVLAVDDLDFSVDAGDVCGMLGPNGAGKTTTLRMLLGLIRPTSGDSALFEQTVRPGLPTSRASAASSRVPPSSPTSRVSRTCGCGGSPPDRKWSEAAVDDALAVAGLGDAVERKVKTYSHGMKQRLGIARALLAEPGGPRPRRTDDRPRPAGDPRGPPPGPPPRRTGCHDPPVEPPARRGRADVQSPRGHGPRRLVAAGTVAELMGDTTAPCTSRSRTPTRPGAASATSPASQSVEAEQDGLVRRARRDRPAAARDRLVQAASGSAPSPRGVDLEDTFLGLVGEHHAR